MVLQKQQTCFYFVLAVRGVHKATKEGWQMLRLTHEGGRGGSWQMPTLLTNMLKIWQKLYIFLIKILIRY